jgi:type I site-specific restriction endonuclease
MMNLIDTEDCPGVNRFGIGHFDLVIIDEAHRSVYQEYGTIFSYFDALLSGLTATPREEIDRNTFELFDLDVGLPTDEYGLDQAIADGYLVPLRPISLPLKFPQQGSRYDDLSEAEKAQWDLLDWEDDNGRLHVDSGAINSWLFNADTVDKALDVLMRQGCYDASGDQKRIPPRLPPLQARPPGLRPGGAAQQPHRGQGTGAHQELLRKEWWQDLSLAQLEDVRRRLRGLVGMIDPKAQAPLYTNFSDELGELQELGPTALLTSDAFRQFRLRALAFLREHEDHLTMQRLRRNQPLTPTDLKELEALLLSHGIGDAQVIARAAEEANGLGLFIRSLVGLERSTAKALFADFLTEATHSATQIRFINDIINELTCRGVMDPARVYDPPFSELAPTGPEELFSEQEIDSLCDLLHEISDRARAGTAGSQPAGPGTLNHDPTR